MQPAATGTTARPALFTAAFAALIATSFCFVLRAMVIDDWGREFALSATQQGELLGVGLWPFSISIVLLSLVVDRIGFKATLAFALGCHAVGLVILLTAAGYWGLYAGTFVLALGNGSVEAAINPLVATAYADDKTRWLNRLHAGWPGGLLLGGLLALALGAGADWRVKIAMIGLPVLLYGVLLARCRFPVSERVARGVSYRAMLAEAGAVSTLVIAALIALEVGRLLDLPGVAVVALIAAATLAAALYTRSAGRPLYIALMLLMVPLAITELSTDSWVTSLMEPVMGRIGLQPGWVLVYMSAIVFVLRLFAGSLAHKLSPFGLLAASAAVCALGLHSMAGAAGLAILAAATLYAIGKSFFWATSLGVAAELFPRGGAVTLNVMAGSGMLAAGIIGSVFLGSLQDRAAARHVPEAYLTAPHAGLFGTSRGVDTGRLAAAPAADRAAVATAMAGAKQDALRGVALLPAGMTVSYLGLMLLFRRRGGYRATRLEPAE